MFGLGVALSRERPAIIQALLKLVLTLFRVLAPILAGVILLFLAALPLTGIETLWDTGFASRILLSAVFLFVIFQNTVIQAGESDNTFWKPAEWMVMAANVVMPVLAILAGSAILLRVGQYGWSPARFYMALLTGVALAYGLAYAGSVVVRRGAWMGGVIRFNPILALGMLTLAILMHLPPIEPYGISARDQLARLRDGRISPETFDFAFLKFRLGKAGRDVPTDIETDEALAKRPLVVERLKLTKGLRFYSRHRQNRRMGEKYQVPIPELQIRFEIAPASMCDDDDRSEWRRSRGHGFIVGIDWFAHMASAIGRGLESRSVFTCDPSAKGGNPTIGPNRCDQARGNQACAARNPGRDDRRHTIQVSLDACYRWRGRPAFANVPAYSEI